MLFLSCQQIQQKEYCFKPLNSYFLFLNLAELADVQAEQQREMEGLLDNVRQLTRDLRLQMLVIDAFIPPEYQVFAIDTGKYHLLFFWQIIM